MDKLHERKLILAWFSIQTHIGYLKSIKELNTSLSPKKIKTNSNFKVVTH